MECMDKMFGQNVWILACEVGYEGRPGDPLAEVEGLLGVVPNAEIIAWHHRVRETLSDKLIKCDIKLEIIEA